MKKYRLPTFPIYERMEIGYDRADDELAWLLNNGYFIDSVIAFYRKIVLRDGEYVLLRGIHERHLAHKEEEVIGKYPTLEKLLKSRKFGDARLGRWYWFGDQEN